MHRLQRKNLEHEQVQGPLEHFGAGASRHNARLDGQKERLGCTPGDRSWLSTALCYVFFSRIDPDRTVVERIPH